MKKIKGLLFTDCQSLQISRRGEGLMRRRTGIEGGRKGWLKVEADSALLKSGAPVDALHTKALKFNRLDTSVNYCAQKVNPTKCLQESFKAHTKIKHTSICDSIFLLMIMELLIPATRVENSIVNSPTTAHRLWKLRPALLVPSLRFIYTLIKEMSRRGAGLKTW